MADLDALRETLERLAHWMENVVGALDRHSVQLARHEEQLRGMQTGGTEETWPAEVLRLVGASNVKEARDRLALWKASHERESALMRELQEAADTSEGRTPSGTPRQPASFGLPEIDLKGSQIAAEVIGLVSKEVAEKYQCLPVLRVGRTGLLMAMSSPINEAFAAEIERLTGFTVEILAAQPQSLREAIDKYYPREPLGAPPST